MSMYIDVPVVAYKRFAISAFVTDKSGNKEDVTDEVFSRVIDKYPYDREHPIAAEVSQ